ncbi:MAG: hypothetical protein KGI37_09455 [Alphaproteobacteria bacterium]|nr:hypothetical protein [Alphaproteobacteria bacterium]
MPQLNELKKNLSPGQVYRRADLAQWSKAVDRHLHQLQEDGSLTKLSGGLYYYPKKTAFGVAPADDKTLVQAFLKDDRFLLTSPNAYNALGVGTTQLYNTTYVYNRKRHGRFTLGNRTFEFRMKPYFPQELSEEFLLVDLVNNIAELAENREAVLAQVKLKAMTMDAEALSKAVRDYGNAATKKFFARCKANATVSHAIH